MYCHLLDDVAEGKYVQIPGKSFPARRAVRNGNRDLVSPARPRLCLMALRRSGASAMTRSASPKRGGWPRLSGVEMTTIGIVLLGLSLVSRHVDALQGEPWVIEWCRTNFHIPLVPAVTSWCGSILVIVGLGRILFIEDH